MTRPKRPVRGQKSSAGFGVFLLKAIVLFVVIAGGVATGFLVATHLGRGSGTRGFDFEPSDLFNQTDLSIGDHLPDITVYDRQDSTRTLSPLLLGRKAIVAFISEGCEPCEDLLSFLEEREVTSKGGCRVVLLTLGFNGFQGKAGFDVFRFDRKTLGELKIRIFPTVVGLESDGRIAFVSSGFSRVMAGHVIAKYL